MFEGVTVRIRRPADYNAAAAAPLGPSMPNPNLNLAAIGLDRTPAAAALAAPPAQLAANLLAEMAAPPGSEPMAAAAAPAMPGGGLPPGMTEGQLRHMVRWLLGAAWRRVAAAAGPAGCHAAELARLLCWRGSTLPAIPHAPTLLPAAPAFFLLQQNISGPDAANRVFIGGLPYYLDEAQVGGWQGAGGVTRVLGARAVDEAQVGGLRVQRGWDAARVACEGPAAGAGSGGGAALRDCGRLGDTARGPTPAAYPLPPLPPCPLLPHPLPRCASCWAPLARSSRSS